MFVLFMLLLKACRNSSMLLGSGLPKRALLLIGEPKSLFAIGLLNSFPLLAIGLLKSATLFVNGVLKSPLFWYSFGLVVGCAVRRPDGRNSLLVLLLLKLLLL